MTQIGKMFKTYIPFTRNHIQSQMAYRFDFLIRVIGGFLWVFVTYFLWKAIFDSTPETTLRGFTFEEMTIYIFIGRATNLLINTSSGRTISNEIRSGNIAITLMRPINYHLQQFFIELGARVSRFLFHSLPIWVGFIIFGLITGHPIAPGVSVFGFYLLSIILSFIMMFLMEFLFGMLAFYTINMWGLALIYWGLVRFLSGGLIPLTFFPDVWQKIFAFLPFQFTHYTPIMIYLQKYDTATILQLLGLQIFWITLLFLFNWLAWKRAVKRLMIMGG